METEIEQLRAENKRLAKLAEDNALLAANAEQRVNSSAREVLKLVAAYMGIYPPVAGVPYKAEIVDAIVAELRK